MTARLDPAIHAPPAAPVFGLPDLVRVVVRRRWLVAGLPTLASILAAAISLFLPEVYTATAKILPPQQQQSGAAALLGQLGGISAGLGGGLGMKNPADLYVGMLKSRSIADAVIERFELKQRYEVTTMDDARVAFDRRTTFLSAKDGIITIETEDREPAFAAELANAIVAELSRLTDRLALSESSQRRAFFERQVREARESLANAESDMQKTQERTGLIRIEEQGQAMIQAAAAVKAQIMAKEVQMSAMRSFAAEGNPELVRLQREIEALRVQARRLEREPAGDNGIFVPTGKVPQLGVDYLRALRELKYREAVFEVMVKQFEMARVEEARNAAIVQVIDTATAPERRSWPRRTLIVAVAFAAALVAAIALAILLEIARFSGPRPQAGEGGARLAAG
jgi:uncharacterized protein involved in exopolysaccharide biosynthesis